MNSISFSLVSLFNPLQIRESFYLTIQKLTLPCYFNNLKLVWAISFFFYFCGFKIQTLKNEYKLIVNIL